jgi:hypothetical protein
MITDELGWERQKGNPNQVQICSAKDTSVHVVQFMDQFHVRDAIVTGARPSWELFINSAVNGPAEGLNH